jgi:hypothetical protein
LLQIREEVSFTKGRIIVRGKLVTRGKGKRADYILYFKPNIPLALIEAKDNTHSVGDGMQQGLEYAETLDIPYVFSSNGDGFVFHDRTGKSATKEASLPLSAFPSPTALWEKFRVWKGLTPDAEAVVLQDYFDDGSGKAPRYYQVNAVNAAIEAIAKGRDRILLVMATGTGKTYTAFQIIWRLWRRSRRKRRWATSGDQGRAELCAAPPANDHAAGPLVRGRSDERSARSAGDRLRQPRRDSGRETGLPHAAHRHGNGRREPRRGPHAGPAYLRSSCHPRRDRPG